MPRSYKKKVVSRRVVRHHQNDAEDSEGGGSAPEVFNPFKLLANLFRRHVSFRVLVVEVPLLILLAAAFISHGMLDIHAKYFNQYLRSLQFTSERQEWEQTYPRMECSANDLSDAISDPSLLFVGNNDTYLDVTEKVLEHGAAVLPNILSPEASSNLRRYIQKRNGELQQSEEVYVIMNEHRISFTLSALEHPSVARALQEIGHNKNLVDTLEALLGPDPSLMEFQVITVQEGASGQYFHADTPPRYSASMSHFTFHPLYSLLIPLQDTTPDQGPTAVCPGSHRCYFTPSCYAFGDDYGDNTTEQVGFQVVDPSLGYWEAGHGLLYSSSTSHRGTSHVKGPDRVALILSFTGRPDHERPSQFSRFPPLDSVYGIRWFHMGQSLSDLKHPYLKLGFSITRWTGLFDRHLAWSSFRFDPIRAATPDQYRFRAEDLNEQKQQLKSLMGFLSAMFFVDVQHAPKHSNDFSGDTEYNAVLLLGQIRIVCLVVVGIIAVFYLFAVANVNSSWLNSTVARLIVGVIILFGSYLWTLQKVEGSAWAIDIRNGDTATAPPELSPPVLSVSEEYKKNLPTPTAQDVLMDSLPSKLAAQAYRLDYIPGNFRWRAISKEQSKVYLLYQGGGLSSVFRRAVLNHIVDKTQAVFYERNALNDFVEATEEEVLQRTRLLMMEHILSPEKRLGRYTDKFHCSEEGQERTLCNSKPQILLSMFKDTVPVSNPPNQQGRLSFRRQALRIPTSSTNSTCRRRAETRKRVWEVGDVVQANLPNTRKWLNARIVSRQDGMYNVKAFSVDSERTVLDASRLREPEQRQPASWARSVYSFDSVARRASVADCRLDFLPDEPKCERSSLHLNQHNPEMARTYTFPDDTDAVEILFDFEEVAGTTGGEVFVRLEGHDLELGFFDPNEEDLIEWGWFADVYIRCSPISETRNTVGVNIPRRWLLAGNELIFGIRVGPGAEIKIDKKIAVLATLESEEIVPIFKWVDG